MITTAQSSRVRPEIVAGGLLLAAAMAAGCTGEEYGSVSSAPTNTPEVVEAVAPKKGAPAPRVPRGPGQAKALQDAAKK